MKCKKLIAILLVIAMLPALSLTGFAKASDGEKRFKTKAYAFRYNSGDKADWKSTMYYTDDYFSLDATKAPDPSMATATYAICLAAMGSYVSVHNEDWAKSDKNLKAIYKKLGFKHYYSNEGFKVEPSTDSIGVGFASKKYKDSTVIAVGIRGAGYMGEWGGNVNVGKTGEHSGITIAANTVIDELKQYIADNNIKGNIKIWMTGYSRGAGVTNLAAARIDEGALKGTKVKLQKKDMFAYCFEPLAAGLESNDLTNPRYDNIWCFINPNDIVPKLVMKEFGFGQYGKKYYYPNIRETENYNARKNKMVKYYNRIPSKEVPGEYCVDDFRMYKLTDKGIVKEKNTAVTQGEFLSDLLSVLSTEFLGSRDVFVNEYQNGFRIALYGILGHRILTGNETNVEAFNEALKANLLEEDMETRLAKAKANPYSLNYGFETVITDLVTESLNEAGINSFDPYSNAKFVANVVKLLTGLIISHPDYAITLIMNLSNIADAHYPETSYAWLQSMDSNYIL